ncbi:hypothetical protein K32_15750 [Kaistia sp. 32K]|uniref:opioid growth factor receptor-related protein n=1 Tax=Kaistia sp. 32K TaxID=2795690 RepID=UPI001916809B|nr:opioid growth factor receptor-related protein [Kaistia sp. 32K]BCP52958.1 hypothetical protein K32_15750 [Kaistia sp. 32K]
MTNQELDTSILHFFAGMGTDDRGRTLTGILAWDDDRLEQVHDYIQWLFPLPEPSAFNPGAPLLTAADIEAFQTHAALRSALRAAFVRLLAFYGFAFVPGAEGARVARAATFPARSRSWLAPRNHNFLRISRILRALTLLGLAEEAGAFLAALEAVHAEHAAIIGETTLGYWRAAAGQGG